VTLQEALDAALLEIQTLTNERDAAVAREAVVAVSLHETILNLEDKTQQNAALLQLEDELNGRLLLVTTQRDVTVNNEVETQRRFEESLEARTQENAGFVVLNQIITNQKDAALKEKDTIFQELMEIRISVEAKTQQSSTLANHLELSRSRESDLTMEKDAAFAHGNSLEAQVGCLQNRVLELENLAGTIPNLQESIQSAHLELKQLPVLQEQLNQSDRKIKSLELKLSNQEQEKKKLLRDLDAKRRRDVDIAKNASKLEVEKQVQAALSNDHQELRNQALQGLQELSLPSDVLREQFSQACVENFPEGCTLNDLFGIIQQLIDHIYTHHGEQMLSVEREFKGKVQELHSMNLTLSTQLKDVKLSANFLKANSDSLQIKLDATLQQLGEKDTQVQSSCSKATELEKTLAQKTQRYDETVTELRSELQSLCQENQNTARQLVEKEQELAKLNNELTQSNQDFAVTLEEQNKLIKSQGEQIAIKDANISQLTANTQQLKQSLSVANADLRHKIAIISQLQVTSKEQEAMLEATRGQLLELETQAQQKDTIIDKLTKRVLMLEAKSKENIDEIGKLNSHQLQYQTQLTQAKARISDLVSQVNVLSRNSVTLQGKFNDTAKEYQAAQGILAEKVALVTRLETALNDANKSLSKVQATLKDNEEEMIAVKFMLDARDVKVKPHEPKGNHPLIGMMNLRGCAWYYSTTLPSALIPLVTGPSI
jgi:chromosome segregation ATPase